VTDSQHPLKLKQQKLEVRETTTYTSSSMWEKCVQTLRLHIRNPPCLCYYFYYLIFLVNCETFVKAGSDKPIRKKKTKKSKNVCGFEVWEGARNSQIVSIFICRSLPKPR
jgi:hypothetical protein